MSHSLWEDNKLLSSGPKLRVFYCTAKGMEYNSHNVARTEKCFIDNRPSAILAHLSPYMSELGLSPIILIANDVRASLTHILWYNPLPGL